MLSNSFVVNMPSADQNKITKHCVPLDIVDNSPIVVIGMVVVMGTFNCIMALSTVENSKKVVEEIIEKVMPQVVYEAGKVG